MQGLIPLNMGGGGGDGCSGGGGASQFKIAILLV